MTINSARKMHVWTHHRWRFPLPPRTSLPARQVRAARRAWSRTASSAPDVHEPDPVVGELAAVHDCGAAVADPRRLTDRARGARPRAAVVARAGRARAPRRGRDDRRRPARARPRRGDEPRRRHPPRRPRLRARLLPVQRRRGRARRAAARRRGGRALVVDCDVHQGDGTAQIFAGDPRTFTLSLHGARNYPFSRVPSDLDVDIASGTGDAATCARSARRWTRARPRAAGVRVLPRRRRPVGGRPAGPAGAQQGRAAGARRAGARPPRRAGAAVCVVLAGGYAEDIRDTVDINAGTVAAVAERARAAPVRGFLSDGASRSGGRFTLG